MKKPKRSEDKYWQGTRNFDHVQFEQDLDDYIIYLESESADQMHEINKLQKEVDSLSAALDNITERGNS